MDVWWKRECLNAEETRLLEALTSAHHRSAFRSNVSTVVVAQTFEASGDLSKAIAAGILTMGRKHAPLKQTYQFLSLEEPWREVEGILKRGAKVPGWGGTFQKDKPDPLWQTVDDLLADIWPATYIKISGVTTTLMEHGKLLYPNPSAYTAATALILELPKELVSYLFIGGRLAAWSMIAQKKLTQEGVGSISDSVRSQV